MTSLISEHVALRPVRSISLCSGVAGLDRGLDIALGGRLNTLVFCEGEIFCAAVLAQRGREGRISHAPIWSDVKSFDAKPFSGQVDIITAGFPCFTAGMHVLTKDGYRCISSLSVGDEVLTHRGRWRPITAVMHKRDVPIRTIRAQGTTDIVTTDEHPFYARRLGRHWNNDRRAYDRVWAEPRWQSAAGVETTDFFGQILPPIVDQPGSSAFWWLVGRYLADGWRIARPGRTRKDGTPMANTGGRVIICCGHHESDMLAEKIAQAGFSACRDTCRTGAKFHIINRAFFRFLEPFGKYAHGKHLSGTAFGLNKILSKAMLDGYISGDGWVAPNGDRHVTTVSERLALGVCLLAQRAYGVVGSIRRFAGKRVCVIEGRTVKERPQYRVIIPARNRSAFIDGDFGWKRVRKNDPCGSGNVYNIAVHEDESYCVNGAIVHNCQPFSAAGKRRGAQDPRHLWPHIARHVATIRPAVLFCENVPGLLTLGFEQVCQDLSAMGYAVEAGIFSAAEIGAPHLRKRLFFIAYTDCSALLDTAFGNGNKTRHASLQPNCDGIHGHVADSDHIGRRTRQPQSKIQRGRHGTDGVCECDCASQRTAQPGVGRTSYGSAYGMDYAQWSDGWEDGVPRVTINQPHRVDRLRALGNAVIPGVAALAWTTLVHNALAKAD